MGQFDNNFDKDCYKRAGLWTWLALAYFSQLRGKSTQREEHFVLRESGKGPGSRCLAYRHSVRTVFNLVKKHGEDAKFFVSKRGMHAFGSVMEDITSDPKIVHNESLLKLIFFMYRAEDGYAKRGTAGKGRGALRRLTDGYLPRIKLTYDVDIMEPKEIMDLCGKEFEHHQRK